MDYAQRDSYVSRMTHVPTDNFPSRLRNAFHTTGVVTAERCYHIFFEDLIRRLNRPRLGDAQGWFARRTRRRLQVTFE